MQTKSKETNVPEAWEDVGFKPVDPLEGQEPHSITVYTPGYQPRSETYTPNSGGNRKAWKDFEHYKSVQAPMPSRGMTLMTECWGGYPHHYEGQCFLPLVGYFCQTWGSYWTPYGDAGHLDGGLTAFYSPRADGGFVSPPQDLDLLLRRGIAAMLPKVKNEMSLVNSILELKDFKRPIESLRRTITTSPSWHFATKKLLGILPSQRTAFKRKPLKSLIRKTSGTYLETSFAWLPLLSDICALKRVVSSTAGRINDLINRAGKRQSRHFRFVFSEYEDSYDEQPGAGWTWEDSHNTLQTSSFSRWVTYKPTVFHAQLEYNYNYSKFQLAHAQLLGHLDALGVNLNPSIVWNAIPFSFIVDWVLKVGPMLDRMGTDNMEPEINIHRLLWSVSRKREIFVIKRLKTKPGVSRNVESAMGRVFQSAYRRQVCNPDLSWYVDTSGLSLRELSLGAALVLAQKTRNRN